MLHPNPPPPVQPRRKRIPHPYYQPPDNDQHAYCFVFTYIEQREEGE